MGRQLPLASTPQDDVALLRYIDSLVPIRVFQSFAPTTDELWITDWQVPATSRWGMHYIWPQSFPWEPRYGQTGGPGCPPERAGRFFVANSSSGPILELCRSVLDEERYGRLYWGRNFSAPHGLAYDDAAFSRLVDSVWRWVRKNGRRRPGSASELRPYFLPDAWEKYGAGT